jgi:general stress protein YciG
MSNDKKTADSQSAYRSGRGFAGMPKDKQKQIASDGGKAAHAKGKAHEFTADEARVAGRRGGLAVSQNREHMSSIGREGGKSRGRNVARRLAEQRKADTGGDQLKTAASSAQAQPKRYGDGTFPRQGVVYEVEDQSAPPAVIAECDPFARPSGEQGKSASDRDDDGGQTGFKTERSLRADAEPPVHGGRQTDERTARSIGHEPDGDDDSGDDDSGGNFAGVIPERKPDNTARANPGAEGDDDNLDMQGHPDDLPSDDDPGSRM